MRPSPLLMPTRKVNHAPARPVYTTVTGQAPRNPYPQPTAAELADLMADDPHCFVCGRHTDHFGEHDALVEAGLAYYGEDGTVYKTDTYDAARAAEIAEAEFQRLYGHLFAQGA